jgi:hypothetical protein
MKIKTLIDITAVTFAILGILLTASWAFPQIEDAAWQIYPGSKELEEGLQKLKQFKDTVINTPEGEKIMPVAILKKG